MLDRAQGNHIWVRWWQWEVAYATKYLVDFARNAACNMHLHRDPAAADPLCANFSDHELLDETRCRYVTGISLFDGRSVDEALSVYAGAECAMRKAFDEIYNTYVDQNGDGAVPDCRPASRGTGEPDVFCDPQAAEPCACPEGFLAYRRYMPDEHPQLQYPDSPACPPRDALFTFMTATGPDAEPVDAIPDWFTCDGEIFCADNDPAVPGFEGGACAADRFGD